MECAETPDDNLLSASGVSRRRSRWCAWSGFARGYVRADVQMVGGQSVQIEDLMGRLIVRSDKG